MSSADRTPMKILDCGLTKAIETGGFY